MPHCGSVLAALALCGLTHKEGYKHIFMILVVGGLLALIPALLLAMVIY
jgi:H+/gluconate symporter-like permease